MPVAPKISASWKVWLTYDGHSWELRWFLSVSQISFNWLAQLRSYGKGGKATSCVTPANILQTKGSHMAKLSVMEWYLFSSVAQSCPTLCDPMNCSTPGLPVHHHLPEFTQTHVHWVHDAIQPSHPLSSPSPPGPNPSQHQSLFQWVSSSHEVAQVLEFQL